MKCFPLTASLCAELTRMKCEELPKSKDQAIQGPFAGKLNSELEEKGCHMWPTAALLFLKKGKDEGGRGNDHWPRCPQPSNFH